MDQSKKDVNISEVEIKAEHQFVVFSIYAVGYPIYGISSTFYLFEGNLVTAVLIEQLCCNHFVGSFIIIKWKILCSRNLCFSR